MSDQDQHNLKQLKELRKQWEGDLPQYTSIATEEIDRVLVVLACNKDDNLKDINTRFRCHRYFKVGFGENTRWEVSVDGDRCTFQTVLKWLADPSARLCSEADDG